MHDFAFVGIWERMDSEHGLGINRTDDGHDLQMIIFFSGLLEGFSAGTHDHMGGLLSCSGGGFLLFLHLSLGRREVR